MGAQQKGEGISQKKIRRSQRERNFGAKLRRMRPHKHRRKGEIIGELCTVGLTKKSNYFKMFFPHGLRTQNYLIQAFFFFSCQRSISEKFLHRTNFNISKCISEKKMTLAI